MKNRRFKFIRSCNGIETDTQLDLFEGRIYLQNGVNGGQVPDYMYKNLLKLIETEDVEHYYLKEIPIPYNKV